MPKNPEVDAAWLREVLPFPVRCLAVGDSRIHYLDEGSGPPLLLLTNSPVWCLMYRGLVRELRAKFRCIVPDFPGFGLSPTDGLPVTLMRQSAIVQEFARALGLSDVIMMVHALAGPPGLDALTRTPELFRGLVICNTFAPPPTGFPRGMMRFLGSSFPGRLLIVQLDLLGKAVAQKGILRTLSPAELRAYRSVSTDPQYRRRQHALLRNVAKSQAWLEDLRLRLRGLPIPTLLLWGEHDRGIAMGMIEDFQSLLPHSEAVIVKDGGHFAPEDVPEEMARELASWWQRLESQRSIP